jgi:hypothetical protein
MSADFISIAMAVDPSLRPELLELMRSEVEYNGNVYLECGVDDLVGLLGELYEGSFAMSPNFPSLVAIDRFGADRQLLEGHAARYVSHAQLKTFAAAWKKLKTAPDLVERAFAAVDRGYNDESSVTECVDAVDEAIELAQRRKVDLVLLSVAA